MARQHLAHRNLPARSVPILVDSGGSNPAGRDAHLCARGFNLFHGRTYLSIFRRASGPGKGPALRVIDSAAAVPGGKRERSAAEDSGHYKKRTAPLSERRPSPRCDEGPVILPWRRATLSWHCACLHAPSPWHQVWSAVPPSAVAGFASATHLLLPWP